jgi:hypothetical protein
MKPGAEFTMPKTRVQQAMRSRLPSSRLRRAQNGKARQSSRLIRLFLRDLRANLAQRLSERAIGVGGAVTRDDCAIAVHLHPREWQRDAGRKLQRLRRNQRLQRGDRALSSARCHSCFQDRPPQNSRRAQCQPSADCCARASRSRFRFSSSSSRPLLAIATVLASSRKCGNKAASVARFCRLNVSATSRAS